MESDRTGNDHAADRPERWISRFRGPLVGLIASWGAPWRDADELAQDAIAEGLCGLARFRGDPDDDGAVGAWLRGVAFRLFARWQRDRGRAGLPLERAPEPATAPPHSEGDERAAVVRRTIERMPRDLRAVLWMRYLEGTPVARVAALLGETEKAVESRITRARRELKRRLMEETTTPDGRPKE